MPRLLSDLSREEQRKFDDAYAEILDQTDDVRNDPEDDDPVSAARRYHDRVYTELLRRFGMEMG